VIWSAPNGGEDLKDVKPFQTRLRLSQGAPVDQAKAKDNQYEKEYTIALVQGSWTGFTVTRITWVVSP